jgi:hypothetical protein
MNRFRILVPFDLMIKLPDRSSIISSPEYRNNSKRDAAQLRTGTQCRRDLVAEQLGGFWAGAGENHGLGWGRITTTARHTGSHRVTCPARRIDKVLSENADYGWINPWRMA